MNVEMNDNAKLMELGITNKTPFKVPDGYFESLSSRVMDRVSKEGKAEEKNVVRHDFGRMKRMTAWIASSAACVAIMIVSIQLTMNSNNNESKATPSDLYADTYTEEFVEYSMVDGTDIYAYLSGENY